MLNTLVATGIIGVAIIAIGEVLARFGILKGEYARKFIHILIAMFAATWPYYLYDDLIVVISLVMVLAVIVVSRYRLLQSIKSVRRITYGEVWFPLGIGVSALLFSNPLIFSIAVLHIGLADGLAAVVGVALGKKAGIFKVGHAKKSIAGSLTFMAVSFGIYTAYWLHFSNFLFYSDDIVRTGLVCVVSAFMVTVIEMVSPKGSDNIFVPIGAGVLAIIPTLQAFF